MIVLSSPSGVGKTTLSKKLASFKKYQISISYTTRKPRTNEKDGKDYHFISKDKFKSLIENETITGGMIPKINNCLDVASNGVKGVVIIDGRKNHSILFELLSDKGSGTLIRK